MSSGIPLIHVEERIRLAFADRYLLRAACDPIKHNARRAQLASEQCKRRLRLLRHGQRMGGPTRLRQKALSQKDCELQVLLAS